MPVAQLDRVSDSDSEGRAFESHQAYHVGMDIAPFRFFLCRKISHMRCHSSFIAKRHACEAYSLVNALVTACGKLPPFCESTCGANTSVVLAFFSRNRHCSIPIFLMQKNQSYALSFLLYRKKARMRSLLTCKRACDGLRQATTFLREHLRCKHFCSISLF